MCFVFAVDVQDQRLQLGLEADVVVRASQSPLVAELVERDSADRAGLLIQSIQLVGGLAQLVLGQHAAGGGAAGALGSPSSGVRYCRAWSSHRCNS